MRFVLHYSFFTAHISVVCSNSEFLVINGSLLFAVSMDFASLAKNILKHS